MSRSVRMAARLAVLVVALLVAVLPATAHAAALRKAPKGAAFYTPPKLPKGKHGTLIWAQRISSGPAYLSSASATYRVLFTTETLGGKRVGASGLVSLPKGKAPRGGWKTITWAHGTTGTADVCAPSRVTNADSIKPYVDYVNPQLNGWLKAGYAIARADYEGLGVPGAHPYLVGGSEGRSVLDVVRAARGLDTRISRTFAIAGHSQGGHAALFAGGLRSWTPELQLRGVASYAPASHLKEQAALLPALTTPSALSGLAALIIEGASSTTTKLDPGRLLSDAALARYPQVDTKCLDRLGLADSLGGLAPSTLLRTGADLTDLGRAFGEMNPALRIRVPVLMLQGLADTTVFPNFTNDLDKELVAKGDAVTYKTYPGVTHGGIVQAANADATAFLKARLK